MTAVEGRRRSIDSFRDAFVAEPYRGYDVIVVSSSTGDEARRQQDLLAKACGGIRTANERLGRSVLVLSVVDPTYGGQVIGQVFTWKRAIAEAERRGVDLRALFAEGAVKVAVYHNGGRGERASPLTQGLGNSRGSQRLVGTVSCAGGVELEQELLLSVVLQTSGLARTCDGRAVDTYWTSQLLFPTREPEAVPRTGAPLEKLVVLVDRDTVRPQDLHDFGTALIRSDGFVETFYRNKLFAELDRATGTWKVVEARRSDWDRPGFELGFDFGSFRTRRDLHLALMEFYDLPDLWEKVDRTGLDRTDKRDIDPHVIQPLVALLRGIPQAGPSLERLPPAAELRGRVAGLDGGGRARVLEGAVNALRDALPRRVREAVLPTGEDPRELDMLAFYLLYRDRPFLADPARVVGTIRFDAESYWFTYRRPVDIGNEKFLMLSDLTDRLQSPRGHGSLDTRPAARDDRILAEDARRLRGIPADAIARFRVARKRDGREVEVRLDRDALAKGWRDEDVRISGSVIRGDCLLLPGSRVVDSVLHHVCGRIHAESSYLESVTAPSLRARNSIVHKLVDTRCLVAPEEAMRPLVVEGEIVSDAFREGLADRGFPEGQARLRAPLGHDPQSRDEVERTEGGELTFAEVRNRESSRSRDESIEDRLREAVRRRIG